LAVLTQGTHGGSAPMDDSAQGIANFAKMVRSNEDRTLLAVLTQGTHGGVPLWMTALRGVTDDRTPTG